MKDMVSRYNKKKKMKNQQNINQNANSQFRRSIKCVLFANSRNQEGLAMLQYCWKALVSDNTFHQLNSKKFQFIQSQVKTHFPQFRNRALERSLTKRGSKNVYKLVLKARKMQKHLMTCSQHSMQQLSLANLLQGSHLNHLQSQRQPVGKEQKSKSTTIVTEKLRWTYKDLK